MAAVGDEQGRPAGTDRDGERYRPPIGFAEPEQQGDQRAGDERHADEVERPWPWLAFAQGRG